MHMLEFEKERRTTHIAIYEIVDEDLKEVNGGYVLSKRNM